MSRDCAEGVGRLWWVVLEGAIAGVAAVEVTIRLNSPKQAALDRRHDWLRSLPEHDLQRKVSALRTRHGVDQAAICRDLRTGAN